jgi:Fe-S cluster biogenesis protein NfuA
LRRVFAAFARTPADLERKPPAKPKEARMREKVEKVLAEIRPHLEADGGNIELIDVEEGIVKVKLVGACGSCPMSQMTLKRGVEARLKAKIPEVKEVVSV